MQGGLTLFNTETFFNATLTDMKRGYCQKDEYYLCLICGEKIEKGLVYPCDGRFMHAWKYMENHILKEHGSVFEYLANPEKKLTGLSEHQIKLASLFYNGKSDTEIQKELSIGSASTIRNHRFALKEKEKQAKAFLVIMELLKEKNKNFISASPQVEPASNTRNNTHNGRSNEIAKVENDKILLRYFPNGMNGKLKTFYMKEKSRIVVLENIAGHFQKGRKYAEKELNHILKEIYEEDYVAIRRYLVDYGFMDRDEGGKAYWLKDQAKLLKTNQSEEIISGAYQIKNLSNQKVFIASCRNLGSLNGPRFSLNHGSHGNKELQKDWTEFGESAFEFSILESFLEKEDARASAKEAKRLEKYWIDQLQPFGDKGYHKSSGK